MRRASSRTVDFDAVKRVPVTAILARYGIELKRVGQQLVGCCPIHKGTNRRAFAVNPGKNLWTCFGDCQTGGTSIDLVAALEGVAARDAAGLISEWFAVFPVVQPAPATERRRMKVSGHPSHKVFAVEDRGEADNSDNSWWTRCGSAWPHKDGKGLNVVLSALPVNGRLVLREFDPEDAKKEEREKEEQKSKRSKK